MKTVRNVVLGSIAAVTLTGALATAGFVYWVTRDLPSYETLAHYEPPITTRVYAGNGTLIGEYARERRLFVPIDQIPNRVKEAFISAEDKNFYSHPGIDVIGILRAVINDLRNPDQRAARRLHHHPAGGAELPAVERAHDLAQDPRDGARDAHRQHLLQGQDPRALSERNLPRREFLRRRRRGHESISASRSTS